MIIDRFFNFVGTWPYGSYLQNKWAFALLILVCSGILAWLMLFIFEKGLQRLAKKTKTEADDIIFEKTKGPIFYLILAYGLKLALAHLNYIGIVSALVNTLMAVVFVFILSRVVNVTIEIWGKDFAKKTKSSLDDVLLPMFHKAVNVAFVIIGIMWVLKIWNIDIGPYLAGAGILGVVIGFGLQDSLKNIFGGVTLLLDKTYKIGDKVKLDGGEVGTILDIGLRSTKMRTYDNEVIYIPNGYLANSKVQNYTRPSPKVRVGVEFGVEYGNSVAKVRELIVKTITDLEGVLPEPVPAVHFLSMGDSALAFKAYFWVEKWDQAYDKKLETTEAIYNALNKANIGIPFPTSTVYLKK
jgi:small-conductance mechanosensitive channel